MITDEDIKGAREGDIRRFWEICTALSEAVFLFLEKQDFEEESIGLITVCIDEYLKNMDQVTTVSALAELTAESLSFEAYSRDLNLSVSKDELMRLLEKQMLSGSWEMSGRQKADLVVQLGLNHQYSELGKRYTDFRGRNLPQRQDEGAFHLTGKESYSPQLTTSRDTLSKTHPWSLDQDSGGRVESDDEDPVGRKPGQPVRKWKMPVFLSVGLVVALVLIVGIVFVPKVFQAKDKKAKRVLAEEDSFEPERISELVKTMVLPSVHETNDDECRFVWSITESELSEWLHTKMLYKVKKERRYLSLMDQNREPLKETFDSSRLFYIECRNEEGSINTDNQMNAYLDLGNDGYRADTFSSVSLVCEGNDLTVIEKLQREFLAKLQLEEYADVILNLHDEVWIDTQNEKGRYMISMYSGANQGNRYLKRLKIFYHDEEYALSAIDKKELKQFISPADIFSGSSLDTTDPETFFTDLYRNITDDGYGNWIYQINLETDMSSGVFLSKEESLAYTGFYEHNFEGMEGLEHWVEPFEVIHMDREEDGWTMKLILNGKRHRDEVDNKRDYLLIEELEPEIYIQKCTGLLSKLDESLVFSEEEFRQAWEKHNVLEGSNGKTDFQIKPEMNLDDPQQMKYGILTITMKKAG